jgi:hypothetical protein
MPLELELNYTRTPPLLSLHVGQGYNARCWRAIQQIADPAWRNEPGLTEARMMILFRRRIALGEMLSMRNTRIDFARMFPGLFVENPSVGVQRYAGQEARLWLAFYDLMETLFAEGVILEVIGEAAHPLELLAIAVKESTLLMPEAQRIPEGYKRTLARLCGEQNRQMETDFANPFTKDAAHCPVTSQIVDWDVDRGQRDEYVKRKWYTLTQARSKLTVSHRNLGCYTINGNTIETRGGGHTPPTGSGTGVMDRTVFR